MKPMHAYKRCHAMGSLCLCLAVSGSVAHGGGEAASGHADRLEAAPTGWLDVAAVTTVYRENSHAEVIVGRLLDTHTLDGKGRVSPLRLRTLYTDQVPVNDTSRRAAAAHGRFFSAACLAPAGHRRAARGKARTDRGREPPHARLLRLPRP